MYFTEINGIHPQLKERLIRQAWMDLNELASKVVRIKQYIHENEKKCAISGKGTQFVSLIDKEESDDNQHAY